MFQSSTFQITHVGALQIHYGYSFVESVITQRSVITCLGTGAENCLVALYSRAHHSINDPRVMTVIKLLAMWKFNVDNNTHLLTKYGSRVEVKSEGRYLISL